jgi:choline kinase
VEFVVNPFYRVSNSVASLWFARESLKEDTDYLFGNADVFFEEEILNRLLDAPDETVLLSDSRRALCGDYLFGLENGYIRKYGKDLPVEDRDCEYVGMGKVKHSYMGRFCEILEQMIDEENYQTWWEVILYDHCLEQQVRALDVAPYFWSEIDYIEDYMKILEYTQRK